MENGLLGAAILYLVIGTVKTFTREVCNRNGTPGTFYDYIICIVLWPFIKEQS